MATIKQGKVKISDRPTCSCGSKMKLIQYTGYYDDFRYWKCDNDNCLITAELSMFEADRVWKGGYA